MVGWGWWDRMVGWGWWFRTHLGHAGTASCTTSCTAAESLQPNVTEIKAWHSTGGRQSVAAASCEELSAPLIHLGSLS